MNRLWTLITDQPHLCWYYGPLFSGEPQGAWSSLPVEMQSQAKNEEQD